MSGVLNLIWGVREAKYFCSWDWTGFRVRGLTLPVGQSHCGQAVHGLATASLPRSNATKQSTLSSFLGNDGLLRRACHRTALLRRPGGSQ
jgi:hypothetical protein